MRFDGYPSLLLFIATAALSCNPCDKYDCVTSDELSQFSIIRKSTGEDLVFGPNRLYNSGEIKFYSVNGSDTTYFDCNPIPAYPAQGVDSTLMVHFFQLLATTYIRLNSSDTDTLFMSFDTRRSKCCGTIKRLEHLRHNDSRNARRVESVHQLEK